MTKPYYEPIEPDWEKDVADAALNTWKRLFRMSTGYDFPDGAIPSPAAVSIIRNPNGARTFPIPWSNPAARQAVAMPTAPAGLKSRCPRVRK